LWVIGYSRSIFVALRYQREVNATDVFLRQLKTASAPDDTNFKKDRPPRCSSTTRGGFSNTPTNFSRIGGGSSREFSSSSNSGMSRRRLSSNMKYIRLSVSSRVPIQPNLIRGMVELVVRTYTAFTERSESKVKTKCPCICNSTSTCTIIRGAYEIRTCATQTRPWLKAR
jgi:hypothetical protein